MPIAKRKRLGFVLLCLALTFGCSLPFGKYPILVPEIPVDQTLTALFGSGIFGTLTVLPGTATQTPVTMVTATSPADTSTPVAEPTSSPSPALTATHTQVPTVAITQLPGRPSVVYADYRGMPNIDGVWDEWTSTIFPANTIIFGLTSWSGEKDLQASYRIGWDETNLYLAVKVIDDKYVQNAAGAEIYKGDSVEVLLDVDLFGDFSDRILSSDDYQLLLSPGRPGPSGTKEAYLYFPRSLSGSRSQVQIASVGGDGLYRMEAVIPWQVFGVSPSRGKNLGFALRVSDNDDSTQNIQQSMTASVAGNSLLDPTTWMQLILR